METSNSPDNHGSLLKDYIKFTQIFVICITIYIWVIDQV